MTLKKNDFKQRIWDDTGAIFETKGTKKQIKEDLEEFFKFKF